jgi:hypothetical protein
MIDMPSSKIKFDVTWTVNVVRFFCLQMLHFTYANSIKASMQCMKYLALHGEMFKYKYRAFLSCQLAIISVLVIESLSIKYMMVFSTVLDVINNFIKMKLISMFDDFFIEPY